jgi:hypothetical protein
MRYPFVVLWLVFVLGCGAGAECGSQAIPPRPSEAKDQPSLPKWSKLISSLQGEWVVVSSTGQPDSGHVFLALVKMPILISGDTMSWVEWAGLDSRQQRDHWMRLSKRIVPRPEISAVAVDLEPDFPKYKTWSRVGIIRASGDELQLCVNFPQGPRPSEFKGAEDGREYVVLRRVLTKEAEQSQP